MYSQLGQDLWVLEKNNGKQNGFFIDIGAYDGVYHSNSYLLDQLGWSGICVEPSSKYNELKKNRPRSINDDACIYSVSNQSIDFYEIISNMELSGINNLFQQDNHDRNNYSIITVKSLSLTDLCIKYQCPNIIDYLSIDTEGSELSILETHDFIKYRFNYISIEHNRNIEYREAIYSFLSQKNYRIDDSERFNIINNNPDTNFDDWYIYQGI
jgi:FkbM family methyltransferase